MKWCISFGVLLAAAALASAAGVPTRVHYVASDDVVKTMATGGQIITDDGFVVLANRRGTAAAEAHAATNHVFIITEGEATLVTGGALIAPRELRAGQLRGTGIAGGQTHQLRKGDVITIPAKTPHWFKDVPSGSIAYYAVNIEQ